MCLPVLPPSVASKLCMTWCVAVCCIHADALCCRTYAEEQRIDPELRKLLPRDEGKPIEKPAELALRERM